MTGEGERVANVLGLREKSKVSMSADVCDLMPRATYTVNLRDQPARLPHPDRGGEAESAAAAEDAVWKGETSPSVCLSVCLPGVAKKPAWRERKYTGLSLHASCSRSPGE